jgi:mono/diheme cytochrome c family protein
MFTLTPRFLCLLLAALLVLASCSCPEQAAQPPRWPVPQEASERPNPVAPTAESIAAGTALYREHCAVCHGVNGDGKSSWAETLPEPPADLTDGTLMGKMTDGEIFWKLTTGRDMMPPFAEKLSEEERWHVVNYLRTLAQS